MLRLATAMILVASASPLGAQTLDIGGIELRLGESGTTALADLRSAYDVRYEESIGMWSIFRKRVADDPYVFVGQVYIKAGVVSRIVKDYELTDQYDLVDVYSTAMKQVRKRGGATCNTWPQEMTDGRFWSIHTTCGSYELTLNLPNRLHGQASGDNRASAGVSATVPKWP